jgi:hypothetical protein
MVGYFYHLDYLHEDNATVAPAVIEAPDSPAPPPKKKARKAAPAKKTRTSTSAPTETAPPSGPKVHLIEHAKIFAMAVEYHIAALQNLAAQKFKTEFMEHWDHEDLAHAIHVIYTSTPEDITQLREVAVEALDAHTATRFSRSRRLLLSCAESLALLATCSCAVLTSSSLGIQAKWSATARTNLVTATTNKLDVDSATKISQHA